MLKKWSTKKKESKKNHQNISLGYKEVYHFVLGYTSHHMQPQAVHTEQYFSLVHLFS